MSDQQEIQRLRALYERERDIAEQAQGEFQRLREALIEIKRLVTESRGRIWTGVGIVAQVDAALSPQKGETNG